MKKSLLALLLFAAIHSFAQIRFTVVDPYSKGITIKNFGTSEVNVSQYRLSSLADSKALNQSGVSIISGDFTLSPAEEVSVKWNAPTGFNITSADLALYLPTGNLTDPANLVDFMQYGSGEQGMESVAISAGKWSFGTYLSASGPYYYSGDGNQNGIEYWGDQLPGLGGTPAVVINELDPDQTGTDTQEFIELFGTSNASLDGLVLVFFNGDDPNNASYKAFSLTGYTLNNEGFFTIGNAAVPGVGLTFANNTLQNGTDAVAIYQGTIASWPNGTPPTNNNLMDAVVYGATSDPELVAALTPGQIQPVETNPNANALARIPDGGAPFQTSLFVAQPPTPNATNQIPILCDGGTVATQDNETTLTLCSDDLNLTRFFQNSSTVPAIPYIYIATNQANQIILISTGDYIDFTGMADGELHVWGLSYTGTLDPLTTSAGLPVASIISTDCYSLSTNFITITKQPCLPPDCQGGTIQSNDGSSLLTACKDGNADVFTFTNTSSESSPYLYVVSNSGIIVAISDQPIDFDSFPAGTYSVRGLTYTGTLDPESILPGLPVSGILTDGNCLSFSSNSIVVITSACTVIEGCTELFFSEYLEGLGNNKALEIYNPTNFQVNLANYSVKTYTNGSASPTYTLALTGTLDAGSVHLIANTSADQNLLNMAHQTGQVATFNGNDAIVLLHNNTAIDIIGVVGVDPGNSTGWPVASGTTLNHDLVRKPAITAPTTNWDYSVGQWEVYEPTDFTHLGTHIAAACSDIPQIGFTTSAIEVEENVGNVTLLVQAYNIPTPIVITADVSNATTLPDMDYVNIFPVTLSFPAGTSVQSITVPIIDDTIEEEDEFLTISLNSASPVNWVQQDFTLTILHNDQGYPLYSIAEVTVAQPDGVMDSIGVYCELRGVVHGINFNPSGLHFHLIDPTGGIKVFRASENLGYTVNEGDSISVMGEIDQFHGQAEIRPDVISVLGTSSLYPPSIVSVLGEENESHLATLQCVALADVGEWTSSGNGFEVRVTDGTHVNSVWIDADAADVFNHVPLSGHFTLTGIVEQDDETHPYTSEYSLWVRYISDISDNIVAAFTLNNPILFDDDGATVTFSNNSTGATSYNWYFGDMVTSEDETPSHTYDYDWLVSNDNFIVSLTVTNDQNCSDELSIGVDAVYNAIPEIQPVKIEIYPNPFSDHIHFVSESPISEYSCYDITGKKLLRASVPSSRELNVDFSYLPQGVYTVKVNTERGVVFSKIIRQ